MSDASVFKETYLGDGLYVSYDGYELRLRAPREKEDHFIYMDPLVLSCFLAYLEELKKKTHEAVEAAKAASKEQPVTDSNEN